MSVIVTLLLAALGVLTPPRTARAENDAVRVVITGDDALRTSLVAHVDSWLRARGHAVDASPVPPDVLASLHTCVSRSEEDCARKIVEKRLGHQIVMLANVEVSATGSAGRNVTVTAFWFLPGRDAVAERRYCETCTEHTLQQTTRELMTALTTSGHHATGHISITTTPAGAKVVAGGVPLGITPLEYDLAPGNHVVSVSAAGHEVETREVAIRDGETTRLAIPLVASGPVTDRRRSRALPAGLLAGGAVLLGTGALLVAIDEDPSASGPLEIQDTAPLGTVLLASGGAVVIAGALLWFRKGRDTGPVAGLSPHGGYFAWTGRF